MSDSNIISEAVLLVGPIYQRLPNELILEVFKYYIMLTPLYKAGTMIDKNRFAMLNMLKCMNKIRSLSKAMSFLAMEAFYATNDFNFKHIDVLNHASSWSTSMPPALPPVCFRVFLRQIKVQIALEDFYCVTDPADYNVAAHLRRSTLCAVTTAKELLEYCPGARTLESLTNVSIGFCGLAQLELHIYADFRFGKEAALAVIKEAAFAVYALKVVVSAWERVFVPTRTFKNVSCPEVADLIAVELVD